MAKKSFKENFLNKQSLLILMIVFIVIGAGIGGAVLKASENPAFCASCHIMEPYYESWYDSESHLLASRHATEDVDCHQCHEPTIATQLNELFLFVTKQYKVPLEKRDFDRDFCFECHTENGGATTWEEAILATDYAESNPHDSHNGLLECNVCHNMHQPSQAFCAECHIFNWLDDLDEGWSKEQAGSL